jgi:shikimate kinase
VSDLGTNGSTVALRRHVCLIGMPGSGKTTVSKVLSDMTGQPMVDSDALLVSRHGMSIEEMFRVNGETWFRNEERAVIAEMVADATPRILAVGGGAVLNPTTRAVLSAGATVFWLRASIDALLTRVGTGTGRPLLAGNVRDRLRQLEHDRIEIYTETAHHVIDVESLTAVQTAQIVLAILQE